MMATNFATSLRDSYKELLSQGADYFEIDDVDDVDNWYDDSYANIIESLFLQQVDIGKVKVGPPKGRDGRIPRVFITPENYIADTGAPAYLADILDPNKKRNETEAQSAYAVLSIAESPEQIATILSGYYGVDFSPVAQELGRFGGNLKSHTDSSEAQLAELHSFLEPILQAGALQISV